VKEKKASIRLEWSAAGHTGELATLEINLNHNNTHIRWVFNHGNIRAFESLCGNNELLQQRLKESLNLIPIEDPFLTSYVFHIS
jgi:hypothetical protein